MRRALVVVVVVTMTSLLVATGPAVPATSGTPSPSRLSPTANQPAQVDFNNDGFDDLAIGAAREDVGITVNAGAVNVLYGSPTGFPPSTGGQFFTQDSTGMGGSAEPGDGLGTALD
jgi:hypothetical protein